MLVKNQPVVVNSNMEVGDIVLTRSAGKMGGLIAGVTGGHFCHALICVDDSSLIEAIPTGVQRLSKYHLRFLNKKNVCVKRLKSDIDGSERFKKAAIANACGYQQLSYDFKQAFLSIFSTKPTSNVDKLFCSFLIAKAYADAGISLTSKFPHQTTPNDLVNSSVLRDVTEETFSVLDDEYNNLAFMDSVDFKRTADVHTHSLKPLITFVNQTCQAHAQIQIRSLLDFQLFLILHVVNPTQIKALFGDDKYFDDKNPIFQYALKKNANQVLEKIVLAKIDTDIIQWLSKQVIFEDSLEAAFSEPRMFGDNPEACVSDYLKENPLSNEQIYNEISIYKRLHDQFNKHRSSYSKEALLWYRYSSILDCKFGLQIADYYVQIEKLCEQQLVDLKLAINSLETYLEISAPIGGRQSAEE